VQNGQLTVIDSITISDVKTEFFSQPIIDLLKPVFYR